MRSPRGDLPARSRARHPHVPALLAVVVLVAGLALGAAPAGAAPGFTAKGSIRQVWSTGHAVGTSVTLRTAGGATVATKVADAQGAVLFREVTPGTGYVVQAGGTSSSALTVTTPDQHPAASFYEGITLNEGYGYLPTRDGTTLAVNVTFPKNGAPQPWPVLVTYSGYDPAQPNTLPPEAAVYPWMGYAVVAVNMRGTTCSGGAFWFFDEPQRTDGYDAIEAAAHQDWSNGDVGMVGISYSGYSQLYVAATRPPHLRAITPLAPFSDGYRGILYPGGILNDGFARSWALERQEASAPAAHQWVKDRIAGGDTTCAANQALRRQSQDLATEITDGRFFDAAYSHLDPGSFASRINVPTYLSTQWQDEQTGGYGAELATIIAKNTKLRAELSNGTHADPLGPELFLRVTEFVDLYVGKRIPTQQGNAFIRNAIATELSGVFGTPIAAADLKAGGYAKHPTYAAALAAYEAEKPVRIRWENGGVAGKEGRPEATTTVGYDAWPVPGTAVERWYLQPDGALAATPPVIADNEPRGTSTYAYDPAMKARTTFSGTTTDIWAPHPNVVWQNEPEGSSLSFVTPAATTTTAYAGTGSADLWIRSSAADTDLEVTLTEVRPNGTEVYIQSGWLRASRRALAKDGSTPLRPRHTFVASDAAPLPAGQLVPVRIEIFPFAHIVRPGSRLRLNIEAPGGNQAFWAFTPLAGPATNDVGHSVGRPSSVALPRLTDSRAATQAPATAPSCSVPGVTSQAQSLRNQPCRDYRPTRVPTQVDAKAVPDPAIAISWKPPASWPDGPELTGYRVVASTGQTFDLGPATTALKLTDVGLDQHVTFRVAARYGDATGQLSDASPRTRMPTGAGFRPTGPTRLLDTRTNGPRITGGTPRNLVVVGGGVPSTATAVVVNVTVTGANVPSFVTLWPAGATKPTASNVNVVPGQSVPNLATVPVGAGGAISIGNHAGTVDVIVDLVGYFDETAGGGLFTGSAPVRLLDSRGATGGWNAPLQAGTTRNLTVRGAPGSPVPATATAVLANVTVTGGTAESYLRVWPNGGATPATSNLNYAPGQTVANLVTMQIGTGGALRFANHAGSVHVVVDVLGWFDPTQGTWFHAVTPTRILDSRGTLGLAGPWSADSARAFTAVGVHGLPPEATGIVANLTATEATENTYITAYPNTPAPPLASNINVPAGVTVPNHLMLRVGPGGTLALYNFAGTVHLIADVSGWFAPY